LGSGEFGGKVLAEVYNRNGFFSDAQYINIKENI
jgi:hypothetical protein